MFIMSCNTVVEDVFDCLNTVICNNGCHFKAKTNRTIRVFMMSTVLWANYLFRMTRINISIVSADEFFILWIRAVIKACEKHFIRFFSGMTRRNKQRGIFNICILDIITWGDHRLLILKVYTEFDYEFTRGWRAKNLKLRILSVSTFQVCLIFLKADWYNIP